MKWRHVRKSGGTAESDGLSEAGVKKKSRFGHLEVVNNFVKCYMLFACSIVV